jgi:hypothetical protein
VNEKGIVKNGGQVANLIGGVISGVIGGAIRSNILMLTAT